MEASKHTIIIIKNEKNEYLQYYDNRWNCYLFLNTKIRETIDENQIIEELSQILKTPKVKINLKYLFDKVHTKYSETANRDKKYHHYFYEAKVNLPDTKEFMINEKKFKYFSKKELENDERIKKVNGDIISMINTYYKTD